MNVTCRSLASRSLNISIRWSGVIISQTKMSFFSHGIGDWMFSRDGLRAMQKGEISCVSREWDRKSLVVQQVA